MKKTLFVFLLLSFNAIADQPIKSHECSFIEDSLARLSCFDKAFPKSALNNQSDDPIKKAHDRVLTVLKDSDSAKFRNDKKYKSGTNGSIIVCGEVNSKNSYGGFTGFSRYYVNSESEKFKVSIETDSDKMFSTFWGIACSPKDLVD